MHRTTMSALRAPTAPSLESSYFISPTGLIPGVRNATGLVVSYKATIVQILPSNKIGFN
jgi:hypothetical protein